MEEEKKELSETIKEIQAEQEREELKEELREEIKKEMEEEAKEAEEEKKEEPKEEVKEEKVEPKKELTEEEKKKKKKKLIIIISSIAAFLIILAIVLIILLSGKKKYTITFDTAGGSKISSAQVEKGKIATEPIPPTKEGYIFDGWECNGVPYYFNTEVTKDITLKARWVVDTAPKEGDRIKVTYRYNNGDPDKTVEVLYNTRLKEPDDPVYEGYEFNGWYKENDEYEYYFGNLVVEPFTLVAHWEKQKDNEYIVNFNSDGGTRVESQSVKKGLKATEPKDPTKEGYDFVEWQLNGKKYDFNKEVTSNLSLKAKWQEAITVTFDSKGGSSVPSQKVKYGEAVTKPTDPTREGYYFINWMLKDKVYNFEDKVTSSFTLDASWIQKQITCSANYSGGTITSTKVKAEFDKTGKVVKVAVEYIFDTDENAQTYYNLFKQYYQDTPQLSGKKLVLPDVTKNIDGEEIEIEYIGMTKDEFLNSIKNESTEINCE